MKTIQIKAPDWVTRFRVPVIKVRKLATISLTTKIISAAKGVGSYSRREKFNKDLTIGI
jgi:hypothetical protein